MLRRSNLLVRYPGDRYQFRHSDTASYLASLTLRDHPDLLAEKSNQPAWAQAIAYAGLHTPMDDLVRARLNAPMDILAERVLEIARWLPYSSTDAAWKGSFLSIWEIYFSRPTNIRFYANGLLARWSGHGNKVCCSFSGKPHEMRTRICDALPAWAWEPSATQKPSTT